MGNFQDILKKKAADVERPEPYPLGSYLFIVKGLPKQNTVGDASSKVVEYTLDLISPQEDVDPQAFAEYTGKFGGFPKPQRLAFFIENQDGSPALWPLKKFLTETLKIEEGDKEMEEMINESVGKQGIAKIGHKPDKKGGDVVYANVEMTFAA